MLKLIVETGFAQGKDFTLCEGETVIGRSSECGVRLAAMDVSRKHLSITVSGNRATVQNLSSHGTQIDGQDLTGAAELADGQRLSLGLTTVLLFRDVPDASDADADDLLAETHSSEDTIPESLPGPSAPPAPPEPDQPPVPEPVSEPSLLPLDEAVAAAPEDEFDDLVSAEDGAVPLQVAVEHDSGPKVDVVVRTDLPEDDFDFVSQESVRPGQIISKDEAFEPVADDFVPQPEAWAQVPSEEGGHTQPMNPEAVKFLRQIQEKRARNRRIMIVAAIVLGLVALAGLIIWL
jgi:predicted component of type VI protein secretion system